MMRKWTQVQSVLQGQVIEPRVWSLYMLSVLYESREISQEALNAEQWHRSGVTKGKGAAGKIKR